MNAGQTLAHYKIIRPLGKGGMGEVYLAQDTKLKREVAIKVLPDAVRQDPECLVRFRREALAAASLKHNNIATIYALEEVEDTTFIVMEYVEGETLSSHIPAEGMDTDIFFDIFLPLADGLAHAHSQGRIHRDLKPGNIMLTPDGIPKILDFGLARIEQEIDVHGVDSGAPTKTMKSDDIAEMPSLTQGRSLLGTPAYMSPEQIEGKKVDARTDLFSFGIVMYEAIAGQRPFKGDTVESIIARILEIDPEPITALKPAIPYPLWSTIRQCLKKDRNQREQTAPELYTELCDMQQDIQKGVVLVDASTIQHEIPETMAPPSSPLWRQPLTLGIALISLVIGLALAWGLKPPPDPVLRKYVLTEGLNAIISPDGTMVAYTNAPNGTIWVRDLYRFEAREIPNTEGARGLFWSPGSDYIGYWRISALHKVAAEGGPSTTISQLPDMPDENIRSATWKPDGTIFFTRETGVFTVSAQGGEASEYLRVNSAQGERWITNPHVLPDGQTLLFARRKLDTTYDIVIQDADTLRSLVHSRPREAMGRPVYTPSGYILYHRGDEITIAQGTPQRNIWAIPFDLSSRMRTGDPILVAENATDPSVSMDGMMVYNSMVAGSGAELVWVDRTGMVQGTIGQPHSQGIVSLDLAPDGLRVAVDSREPSTDREIWIHDADRQTKTRLTFDPITQSQPAWSSDGNYLAFMSGDGPVPIGARHDIMMQAADGGSPMQPLVADSLPAYAPNFSRDGQFLVYHVGTVNTGRDLWMLSLAGDQTPKPILQRPMDELLPSFSPDGRYLAYGSNESGQWEIYVTKFPEGGDRWLVSTNGGVQPRWADEELFYIHGDTLMTVPVNTRGRFRPGTPTPLFSSQQTKTGFTSFTMAPFFLLYDVTADAQRFVMVRSVSAESNPSIMVVENWAREFDRP